MSRLAKTPQVDFVDAEPIVQSALAALGTPLPITIARLGAQGVAMRAIELLTDQGLDRWTAAQFRAAVDQAIREAMQLDTAAQTVSESRTASSVPELGRVEHTVALSVLCERGQLDGYTQDDYVSAFSEAERRLGLRMVAPSSEVHLPSDMRMALAQDPRGLAIHRERCQLESRATYQRDLEELSDEERLDVFERVGNWS